MSGQYYPYIWGYKHATMAGTKGSQVARRSKSHQSRSQFGLQAETRLHEVGIASNGRSAILPIPDVLPSRSPKVGGMIGVKS